MGEIKDLSSTEAIKKIKELAEDIRVCLFCTDLTTQPIATRPMSIQEIDDAGNLWFISSKTSNKNFEISKDNRVQLLFSKASEAHFLSVYGVATIYKDQSTIDQIWTPIAKAWFEEGSKDPDVTVIKVTPSDAYYWDTLNGKIISLIKIAASALTGEKSDGGVEGAIRV
jgi:general stress protein 26